MQEEVWYIIMDGEPRGPLGIRDIDVLVRTNEINSRTLTWRAGLKEWKPMHEIDQIRESILQSSKEIMQISQKKATETTTEHGKDQKQHAKDHGKASKHPAIQEEDEQQIEDEQDPMKLLASTVENIVKNSFHQSADGQWNIYDENKKEWFTQKQQPKVQMDALKNQLINKLKQEFFANKQENHGWKGKKRQAEHAEPEVPLTKEELQKRERNRKKAKKQAEKKKQKWYNSRINTFVYVSGLPPDITFDELKEFAARAGIIRIDPLTGQEKIKIYKDQHGNPKGDAAISYSKEESIQIALEMLNERQIKPGYIVRIERAQFNQKNEDYVPREMVKNTNKVAKLLAQKAEEKQLTWDEDFGDGLKIVIMKNMFTPEQVNDDQYMEELKEDIKLECEKIGPLQRIRFFQSNPEGVVEVKFKEDIDAEKCIQIMNKRYFDGREVECFYWDGETNYKTMVAAAVAEQKNIDEFGNWLEGGENTKEQPKPAEEKQAQKKEEQEGQKPKGHVIQLTKEELQALMNS